MLKSCMGKSISYIQKELPFELSADFSTEHFITQGNISLPNEIFKVMKSKDL